MAVIRVHRPVPVATSGEVASLAARGALPDGAVLTVIDNGKPRARDLLTRIGVRLQDRLPISKVEVHTKPSAGAPIEEDVATMLAVRSHMIISGLGD